MAHKVLSISSVEGSRIKSDIVRIGCPPVVGDAPTNFASNIYLSGNYMWSLKRGGLISFLDSYCNRNHADMFFGGSCSVLKSEVLKRKLEFKSYPDECHNEVKIGLITDDFVSGFKLKALDLICSNCIVVSFSDIRAEFYGIKDSGYFVRYIQDVSEIEDLMLEFKSDKNVCDRFKYFKEGVMDSFNWKAGAKFIYGECRHLHTNK